MAINIIYLDRNILKNASSIYNKQHPKNIRLENFFQKSVFLLLQSKLYNSKFRLKFHPYKYKYYTTKLKEVDSFLNGRYFKNIAEVILTIQNYKTKYEIRKFEAGNYTLLHDTEKENTAIDFVIDFSESNKNYGGYTKYLTGKEELLVLNPQPNTITFIEKRKGIMKYTKYVTHKQEQPIIQIAGAIFQK